MTGQAMEDYIDRTIINLETKIRKLEQENAELKKSLEEQAEDFDDMLTESGYFYKP